MEVKKFYFFLVGGEGILFYNNLIIFFLIFFFNETDTPLHIAIQKKLSKKVVHLIIKYGGILSIFKNAHKIKNEWTQFDLPEFRTFADFKTDNQQIITYIEKSKKMIEDFDKSQILQGEITPTDILLLINFNNDEFFKYVNIYYLLIFLVEKMLKEREKIKQ